MRLNKQISVIVPVYNAEKFLNRCIDSVLNQSFSNFELLLIDDGSTDKSAEIYNEYISKDNRVKVILQNNSGPAAARNTGVKNAIGEYIFFLDADDYITQNSLEILFLNYVGDVDLVIGNFSKLMPNGNIIDQNVAFQPKGVAFTGDIKHLDDIKIAEFIRHFLKHPSNHLISYCWARLYKTSIIKENKISANETMHLFEDFVFNLEYLKHCKKAIFVNKSIYVYVMHDSHVSVSMEIVNGEKLLHDMDIFKIKVNEFFENKKTLNYNIEQEIGHALMHYVIIFLVRSSRLYSTKTRNRIYSEFKKIISSHIYKESLKCYKPEKGNSRLLPILTRLNQTYLAMLYCKRKAYNRYGKPAKVSR